MSKSRRTEPGRKQAPARPGKRDRTAAQGPENDRTQPKSGPRVDPDDPVEEASWESFPASDPPSWNPAAKDQD